MKLLVVLTSLLAFYTVSLSESACFAQRVTERITYVNNPNSANWQYVNIVLPGGYKTVIRAYGGYLPQLSYGMKGGVMQIYADYTVKYPITSANFSNGYFTYDRITSGQHRHQEDLRSQSNPQNNTRKVPVPSPDSRSRTPSMERPLSPIKQRPTAPGRVTDEEIDSRFTPRDTGFSPRYEG